MLVGDGGVGKTSLRHLLVHGKPKAREFSVATDGIDIEVKIIIYFSLHGNSLSL